MTLITFLLVIGCIAGETAEQVLYRLGGRRKGAQYAVCVVPAIAIHVCRMALWYLLLRFLPLGVALPLMGSSYIAVALVGRLMFNEPVDRKRWLGTCLVVAGVVLVAASERGNEIFG